MDKHWKELRNNPPENWQEIWRKRQKVNRFDLKYPATQWVENHKSIDRPLKIDIHPKDGYVVYWDLKTE
jgi:hypothetical protein